MSGSKSSFSNFTSITWKKGGSINIYDEEWRTWAVTYNKFSWSQYSADIGGGGGGGEGPDFFNTEGHLLPLLPLLPSLLNVQSLGTHEHACGPSMKSFIWTSSQGRCHTHKHTHIHTHTTLRAWGRTFPCDGPLHHYFNSSFPSSTNTPYVTHLP